MGKHVKNPNLMTLKESREIIKSNLREMKKYEKLKRVARTPADYTTVMKSSNNILEIENLETCFFTDNGVVRSVNRISFDVPKDSIVGLVGESGCGKSVTSLSVMQLVQAPQGQVTGGEIRFNSSELGENEKGEALAYDITKMPTLDMCRIRGKDISMIFQEPMTSLNPVFTVGYQIEEVFYLNNPEATKEEAQKKAIDMLSLVGIPMPETIVNYYPHQLSGGMRQSLHAKALARVDITVVEIIKTVDHATQIAKGIAVRIGKRSNEYLIKRAVIVIDRILHRR